MKILLIVLALALLGFLGMQATFRFSPIDPTRWHLAPEEGATEEQFEGGYRAVRQIEGAPAEVLARLDEIVAGTPRTRRLAGSVEEGRITYVTRSAFWGFPDLTTASVAPAEEGTRLVVHGRAKYGVSDLGVNAGRVRGWLEELGGAPANERAGR